MAEPLLYTVEESAKRASISRTTMYKLIRSGEVRSIKVRRARRVPPAELEAYITRQLATQTGGTDAA